MWELANSIQLLITQSQWCPASLEDGCRSFIPSSHANLNPLGVNYPNCGLTQIALQCQLLKTSKPEGIFFPSNSQKKKRPKGKTQSKMVAFRSDLLFQSRTAPAGRLGLLAPARSLRGLIDAPRDSHSWRGGSKPEEGTKSSGPHGAQQLSCFLVVN